MASISIMDTLVDHEDRVQTIENFFDLSFLIKDKHVINTINSDGMPMTLPVNNEREESILEKERGIISGSKKQMVLSLSMQQLAELSEFMSGSPPCPLHREDSLYTAADAREQADILANRAEEENKRKKREREEEKGKKRKQNSNHLRVGRRRSSIDE
mmetsp:Transcript_39969/g.40763  ORF Transcript_39969/g.40763 Transcript_39969/m.40763 type:complete len:158 (+) Transcript_39969:136-609(+)